MRTPLIIIGALILCYYLFGRETAGAGAVLSAAGVAHQRRKRQIEEQITQSEEREAKQARELKDTKSTARERGEREAETWLDQDF
jgi:hypothetical protein